MQITICGGGNAAHTLAGLIAARQDFQVNVYTPLNDEVQRWRQGIAAQGGISVVSDEGTLTGRPHQVSDDPATVVSGSRLVLLSLPAFAHEIILEDIAPHLDKGTWVGVLPARGGFDWCAMNTLAVKNESVTIFGLQTLPWACRIRQYGQEVAILGTKTEVDLAVWPFDRAQGMAALLSDLVRVRMQPISGFLSLTLAGTGQLIHPGIMYGLFHDWDGQAYTEAPLFYQGINTATANILQQLSHEVQSLRTVLEQRYPHLDLSAVRPLDEWLRRSYGDDIADTSSLQSSFVTNRSYAGLRAPMRPTQDGLVPDFQARYLAEDIPYGLLVTRGIAELAGVPTPTMDQVINWAQARLGKEYLVAHTRPAATQGNPATPARPLGNGKVKGRDIGVSRAPQRYGFTTLDDMMSKYIIPNTRRGLNG